MLDTIYRMPVSLKDRVALVVGASSGIGRATVVMLAREGMRVMAAARREDRLRELQSELQSEGCTISICPCDASDVNQAEDLARDTRLQFGEVHLMVYATGTNTPDRALNRLRPSIWNELISTNLDGAYYVTQALLPQMREARDGHLIYVASISGHTPDISGAAYQASKRGMIGLCHAVRVEEKDNGIRTTVVCPGLVDTEILDKRPVKPGPEMLAKALLAEHVAEAIVSCAKLPPRACVTEMTIAPTAI
jgi:NADP-dependent 3-hydroxy acid dehydrogenase YdfG